MESSFSVWIGIVASYIGILVSITLTLFGFYRKRAKISIDSEALEFDLDKEFSKVIEEPVNALVISIVNHSSIPMTIKSIKLIFRESNSQKEASYGIYAHKALKAVLGKTLLQSESASFKLSCRDDNESIVIENLESIEVFSTYNFKYRSDNKGLSESIKRVQKFRDMQESSKKTN